MFPVITAFANGEAIEFRLSAKDAWRDGESLSFDSGKDNYRVKPKPSYRPFRCADEFLEYTNKPVCRKACATSYFLAQRFDDNDVVLNGRVYTWKVLLEEFQFSDGTPCGIALDNATAAS